MISIIAAIDLNHAICKDGKLLCHLPNDLKRFKKLTTGKTVIMGRKTWDSLPEKFKPLPKRENVILTKRYRDNYNSIINGQLVYFYNNLEDAINKHTINGEEVFIIGGQSIYEQTIDIADKLYLTQIYHKFENADTFFPGKPEWWWERMELLGSDYHPTDVNHLYRYEFKTFVRK
jgi:dihydrofolate reductase